MHSLSSTFIEGVWKIQKQQIMLHYYFIYIIKDNTIWNNKKILNKKWLMTYQVVPVCWFQSYDGCICVCVCVLCVCIVCVLCMCSLIVCTLLVFMWCVYMCVCSKCVYVCLQRVLCVCVFVACVWCGVGVIVACVYVCVCVCVCSLCVCEKGTLPEDARKKLKMIISSRPFWNTLRKVLNFFLGISPAKKGLALHNFILCGITWPSSVLLFTKNPGLDMFFLYIKVH